MGDLSEHARRGQTAEERENPGTPLVGPGAPDTGSNSSVNEVIKLAYDAATNSLAQQDVTLGNVRNRATWAVIAAGVFASLALNVGVLNLDPTKGPVAPVWLTVGLLVIVGLIGSLVVAVVWPVRTWTFGPSASGILGDEGRNGNSVRRDVTNALIEAIGENSRQMARRFQFLTFAVTLVVLEVLLIIAAQITRNSGG